MGGAYDVINYNDRAATYAVIRRAAGVWYRAALYAYAV